MILVHVEVAKNIKIVVVNLKVNMNIKDKIQRVINMFESLENKINFNFLKNETYIRTFSNMESQYFTTDSYKFLFKLLYSESITPYIFESSVSLVREIYLLTNRKINSYVLEFIIEVYQFTEPDLIDNEELIRAVISYMDKIDIYSTEKKVKKIN
jgi:hypothetical protein